MVHAHHWTPAEADEGEEGSEITPVRPYIEDTDFRLGGSERGINNGFESNPFLEQKVGVLGGGNGGQLVVGGGEEDALTGERVERLEDQAIAVGGETVAGLSLGRGPFRGGLVRNQSSRKTAGGTAGWSRKGMENLLTWKYQLGWPAHSTSKDWR